MATMWKGGKGGGKQKPQQGKGSKKEGYQHGKGGKEAAQPAKGGQEGAQPGRVDRRAPARTGRRTGRTTAKGGQEGPPASQIWTRRTPASQRWRKEPRQRRWASHPLVKRLTKVALDRTACPVARVDGNHGIGTGARKDGTSRTTGTKMVGLHMVTRLAGQARTGGVGAT